MAYEHRPGQFSLFKNDRKTSDRQPDWKGKGVLPNGTPMEIAAWEKQGKSGTFYSLQLSEPLPRGASDEPF